MKITTGPVKNAISLGDMFHDALLSMFQARNPNATDEQIAETEKGIRELIESVADFWNEEVSKPLMAIEKLGKNQYVCWEDPGKEGYDHILESENLNEWLLACSNETELKEMVSEALMHPLLQQHTHLIKQAFDAWQISKERICVHEKTFIHHFAAADLHSGSGDSALPRGQRLLERAGAEPRHRRL